MKICWYPFFLARFLFVFFICFISKEEKWGWRKHQKITQTFQEQVISKGPSCSALKNTIFVSLLPHRPTHSPFCSSSGSLEGKREQKSYKALLEDPMLRFSGLYQENCSDLYVTCQVFAEGIPLALPIRTSYKAFSTRWKWEVFFSVSFCDIKWSSYPPKTLLCNVY